MEYSQSLDFIPEDQDWPVGDEVSEDKKLELRLGPPGQFHGYNNNNTHGAKRVFQQTVEANIADKTWLTSSTNNQCQRLNSIPLSCGSMPPSATKRETQKEILQSRPSFLQNQLISQKLGGMREHCSQLSRSRVACSSPQNTIETKSSNIRTSPAVAVGWPPVRSFRKNLASSSPSKMASESANKSLNEERAGKYDSSKDQLFVKINMEGVPIGRKVNLSACSSYGELSFAIDKLFSGLLAAQRDCSADGNKLKEENATRSSLGRNGEYTLVYEDNEGDRMLVGDVPWHMFISTAKRLRVLKSSELSTTGIGSSDQEKTPLDSAVEAGGR